MFKTLLTATFLCALGANAQISVFTNQNNQPLPFTENMRILYQTAAPGKQFLHYSGDGEHWTQAPGVEMKPSTLGGDFAKENGWYEHEVKKSDIALQYVPSHYKYIANFKFVFASQGNGDKLVWDNNDDRMDRNYLADEVSTWVVTNLKVQNPMKVKPGVSESKAPIRVLYHALDAPFVHFRACHGQWTQAPGVQMSNAVDEGYRLYFNNWHQYDFDASCVELVFNNGTSAWDNNNGENYTINQSGTWAFRGQLPKPW